MEDEHDIIMRMMEATVIASGLRLLIDQLRTSDYVHDEAWKSLLSFCNNLHWKYYKIQTSRRLEEDQFGQLHLKTDDKRSSLNLN